MYKYIRIQLRSKGDASSRDAQRVATHDCEIATDFAQILRSAILFCEAPMSAAKPARRAATPAKLPWWVSYTPSTNAIRGYLAPSLVALVALSGVGALITPEDVLVFEKILPALMLSASFFFGSGARDEASHRRTSERATRAKRGSYR